jgi:hypothetical protein
MDLIEGARVLAERIEARNGDTVVPRAGSPSPTTGALPVFGWLDVEAPAVALPEPDAAADLPAVRL